MVWGVLKHGVQEGNNIEVLTIPLPELAQIEIPSELADVVRVCRYQHFNDKLRRRSPCVTESLSLDILVPSHADGTASLRDIVKG